MRGKRGAGNDLFLDLGADYMHVVYFVKIHYTLYDLHTFYAICQKKIHESHSSITNASTFPKYFY